MSLNSVFIRLIALAVCLCSAAAYAKGDAQVSLFVLQEGSAVEGMELSIDGRKRTTTDADGAAFVDVPAGESLLELTAPGAETPLYSQRIQAGENDFIQLIVTLEPSGRADADVQGGGSVQPEQQEVVGDPGTLSGRITSAEDDSPIEGAQVFVSGSRESARTDADGRFSIQVPEGNYAISIVHPKYTTRTIADIAVAAEETVQQTVSLTPSGLELREFVVTAPYIEGSVASVLSEQRGSSGVVDVLGAEQMSRAGDSNAADALARVTGLTIEDGKFVVIRGAPSRYTQTLLNGSPLPSPDPIKRIVPLNLFPTGALSNISVSKSYDPSQPGAFGAGQIDLRTIGMPDSPFFELSASVGGNTETTGEDGFSYEGGSRDFLGEDDGTRELPGVLRSSLGGGTREGLVEGARQLPNIWEVDRETIGPDTGLGVTTGGQFQLLGGSLGLRGAVNWSRSYQSVERLNRTFAVRSGNDLALRDDKVQRYTDMNVDIGGLFGSRLEWDQHALSSTTFVVRKTQQRTEITEGFDATSDDRFAREFLLNWNERELGFQQLSGEHDFGFVRVDWRGMLAESRRNAPDRREYIYLRNPDGQFIFFRQNGAERRWSESEDSVNSFDLDFTVPVLAKTQVTLDLQTGLSRYRQDRQSETRRLSIDVEPRVDLSQRPEQLLDPANIGETLTVNDDTQTNDNYLGDAEVDAVYLKADIDLFDQLRIVAGARFEQADFLVRTFVAAGSAGGREVRGTFDESDVLPSLSATWRFIESMQLRGSYGRTLSRPVLNELSPARYFDPDTGEEFLGNPELSPTVIDNFDLRWEWYPSSRETVTAGLFFKEYTDPIEQTFTGVGGSNPLRTNQNAESAQVSGIELSARTDFNRILQPLDTDWAWMSKVFIQANAALIESEVELARQGIATNTNRTLQGQADQILNLQIGYEGDRNDWTLSLNHVGERLQLAGREGQPDVFQEPITFLDLKYTFSWSESLKLELSGSNLLDAEVEWLQGGRRFRSSKTGIDLGAGIKYRF